jgi:superfamily II DNA or RNA helicase
MANEGLDIPTLNGLVLSTPKSDIIQSIGRICRMKHENIQPLIIDMVDKFSIFENQSKKRFAVYKKKKYQIEDITYNLEKNIATMHKNYCFHEGLSTDDSDDENIHNIDNEDIYENIDTEYKNIDPKTNKKLKKSIKNKDNFDTEKDNIENLFQSFSLFS